MGDGNLKKVSNGADILTTRNFAQLTQAFKNDFGCRDDNFEAKGGSGSVGTSTYSFNDIFTQNGVLLKGTKTTTEFLVSGTFTVPDQVEAILVVAAGGGSIAKPANVYGSGGGTAIAWVPVSPGDEYDIVIASNHADFNAAALKGWGATADQSSSDWSEAGYATGDINLMPLLVAGGCSGIQTNMGQGTIFASGTAVSGAGYSNASSDAGGGYTAASGTTPGVPGVSVTYWLQSDVIDPN